jgi:hypothetical protein
VVAGGAENGRLPLPGAFGRAVTAPVWLGETGLVGEATGCGGVVGVEAVADGGESFFRDVRIDGRGSGFGGDDAG